MSARFPHVAKSPPTERLIAGSLWVGLKAALLGSLLIGRVDNDNGPLIGGAA